MTGISNGTHRRWSFRFECNLELEGSLNKVRKQQIPLWLITASVRHDTFKDSQIDLVVTYINDRILEQEKRRTMSLTHLQRRNQKLLLLLLRKSKQIGLNYEYV